MSRVFIVTPAYNSMDTIDETISSVVHQLGDFEICYHVQDGGSTDGTVERLSEWSEYLNRQKSPLSSSHVRFSFSSGPDQGMYDAIVKAFSRFDIRPLDWMAWINADDVFARDAFSVLSAIDRNSNLSEFVNWVTGQAATRASGIQTAGHDRLLTRSIVHSGLADGKHWPHVQQEGTFFRARLWQNIDCLKDFSSFRYAGDWNLWRLLAESAVPFQFAYPLGYFTVRPGQLSESARVEYEREIDSVISTEERQRRFRTLVPSEAVSYFLEPHWKSGSLQVAKKSINEKYKSVKQRIINDGAKSLKHCAVRQNRSETIGDGIGELPTGFFKIGATIAFDSEWQFPAVTEQYAYKKAKEILPKAPGTVYFAFPWATYIDLLNANSSRAQNFERLLDAIAPYLRRQKDVVTVCQHIHAEKIASYMRRIGINHVFWSHAVKGKSTFGSCPGVNVYAFPLYPVQWTDEGEELKTRDLLFSFVGAKADKWYLTNTRTLLIKHLQEDPRGYIKTRDQWHYQKVVYEHQIAGKRVNGALVSDAETREFRQLLQRSVFSLCPSGSGPNSIRLWESLGFGAIPVILADTWAPPGNGELWEEAVIFCDEESTSIRALPRYLEQLARDSELIERKRHACEQLWMLYGVDWFIHDVQELFVKLSLDNDSRVRKPPCLNPDALLRQATELMADAGESGSAPDRLLNAVASRILINPEEMVSLFRMHQCIRSAYRLARSKASENVLGTLDRVENIKKIHLDY